MPSDVISVLDLTMFCSIYRQVIIIQKLTLIVHGDDKWSTFQVVRETSDTYKNLVAA